MSTGAEGTLESVDFALPTSDTHFSKMVRASISAFSSPGTSNLLVSVRDTSVLASASLLGSFKLPAPSPKVLGGWEGSVKTGDMGEEIETPRKDEARVRRYLNKPT